MTHPTQSHAQPVAEAALYVEVRECPDCGHIGINDCNGTSACNQCDWTGPSPVEDHCPGCGRDGTMTSACPECGHRTSLLAEAHLPVPAQHAAQPVASLIRRRSAWRCLDGRTSFGEWSDWHPVTLAHGLAVTDPSRNDPKGWDMLPLYTAAPAPVVPLTLDQISSMEWGADCIGMTWGMRVAAVRAVERAHGIKAGKDGAA